MKAQSADYIQLQSIYRAKARKDLAEITDTVRTAELPRAMDEKEIEAFCKNAAFVKLIHGRPIRLAGKGLKKSKDEYLTQWDDRAKYMCQELQNEESLLPIYIAFLAYDWSTEQFAIAEKNNSQDNHHSMMVDYCDKLVKQITKTAMINLDEQTTLTKLNDAVAELARAGGAELHNISALTGGMVAQEVIKVLTKQYVPVDNTCVFDGITSKTAVFNL